MRAFFRDFSMFKFWQRIKFGVVRENHLVSVLFCIVRETFSTPGWRLLILGDI